jgi:hypothetical protein
LTIKSVGVLQHFLTFLHRFALRVAHDVRHRQLFSFLDRLDCADEEISAFDKVVTIGIACMIHKGEYNVQALTDWNLSGVYQTGAVEHDLQLTLEKFHQPVDHAL